MAISWLAAEGVERVCTAAGTSPEVARTAGMLAGTAVMCATGDVASLAAYEARSGAKYAREEGAEGLARSLDVVARTCDALDAASELGRRH